MENNKKRNAKIMTLCTIIFIGVLGFYWHSTRTEVELSQLAAYSPVVYDYQIPTTPAVGNGVVYARNDLAELQQIIRAAREGYGGQPDDVVVLDSRRLTMEEMQGMLDSISDFAPLDEHKEAMLRDALLNNTPLYVAVTP